MLDLIARLPPGSRVLDLGAGGGSFPATRDDLIVVRLDLAIRQTRGPGIYVAGDAARLPFRAAVFDLVVSNHSLEHFPEPERALTEVGRVIRPRGALYVAVPDATTLTDRVYRWMGRGGGHVNAFTSPAQVSAMVERLTGLPHRGTRDLWSSLSFLNARNRRGRPQMKSALFAFGDERFLAVFGWILRWLDRRWESRLSRYGWSFYFGGLPPDEGKPWINVCVRCGSGHAAAVLGATSAMTSKRRTLWRRCPDCGARNLLFAVRDSDPWE